jgi:hypothetical protein
MSTRDERYRATAQRWREIAVDLAAALQLLGHPVWRDRIPEREHHVVMARAAELAERMRSSV